jgi:hypothetical protein
MPDFQVPSKVEEAAILGKVIKSLKRAGQEYLA